MKISYFIKYSKFLGLALAVLPGLSYAAGESEGCRFPQIGSSELIERAKQMLQTIQPLTSESTPAPTSTISQDAVSAPKPGLSNLTLFGISASASTMSATTIYPLDRLKVLKQSGIQSASTLPSDSSSNLVIRSLERAGYGIYDAQKGASHYIKNNMYGGIAPFTALNVSTTGIIYPLHDIFQNKIKSALPEVMSEQEKERYSNAMGGFGAAAVSNGANIFGYNYRNHNTLASVNGVDKYTPKDFAKQVMNNPKTGTHGLAVAPIYSASMAAYYLLYEEFKQQIKNNRSEEIPKEKELSLFNEFIAAAAARTLVSGITHPADTVRILKQDKKLPYSTIIKDQYKKSGVSGFFRALPVTTVRNAASTAISMTAYTALKQYFEEEDRKSKISSLVR